MATEGRSYGDPLADALGRLAADVSRQRVWVLAERVVGLLVVDVARQVVTHANAAAGRLFGYASRRMEGMSLRELLADFDREDHARAVRRFAESPRPRQMAGRVVRARTAAGEVRRVLVGLSPSDDGAEVVAVVLEAPDAVG